MKKLTLLIIMLLIISTSLIGCGDKAEDLTTEDLDQYEEELKQDVKDENPSKTDDTEVAEEEATEEPANDSVAKIELDEGEAYAPLSGLIVDEKLTSNRPVAVMIDNYYKARPQAGLKDAEIIYEALAEGRITRYIAIFQINKPELIGPVRSARPYFVDRALEYSPLYVHVGGSEAAKKDIIDLKMADIDGLKSGSDTFWRKNHKPIPNNMYTSYEAIKKWADRKDYRDEVDIEILKFNKTSSMLDSDEIAEYLKIVYKGATSSDKVGYFIEFKYNSETEMYERYVNGKKHLDELDDTHLSAKNILVQYAVTRVIDDAGRREIDFIGEGNGYYITNGRKINVTWKKESRSDLTRYYDSAGMEIKLNPGVTWIQVVETDGNVEVK